MNGYVFLEGVRSHAFKILSFKSAVSDKVLLARMYRLNPNVWSGLG
jgi:hypothetical protein